MSINTPSARAEPRGLPPEAARLRRSLTLTNAVLYGLGVTIGAGIYVLVGAAAARAGMHAPLAFIAAAVLMALTAASFAELGSRLPVAAGEAAYIRAGFRSETLALLGGLVVVAIAIVSAAAISVGAAGYIMALLGVPEPLAIAVLVVAMGLLAVWGIKESVTFAGVMTLIEVGGLVVLIGVGFLTRSEMITRLPEIVPARLDGVLVAGLMAGTLLAVFAFIGFESIANIAEELQEPERNLPLAIGLTLVITTVVYILVVWVALVTVGAAELAASRAPLTLVFERLTGLSPQIMTVIAIIATLNGIIVQLIMASRVLYGLSSQGSLPAQLAQVSAATGTPVIATALATAATLLLALTLPLDRLAEWTSRLTLVLFGMVNVALILLRRSESGPARQGMRVPAWVPWAGVGTILAMLAGDILVRLHT